MPLLANDLSARAANTISGTWNSTSQYTRLKCLLKSTREPAQKASLKRTERLTYLVNTGDMAARRPALAYAPCIPASPCPQLAPSPALAYPPASALWVSFGICFGWHLAISFSRCFPSSIWSSFPTTFPAMSTAVLSQGVATKCVPVQLHLRILPHHDH